ncbi:Tetratricopeptide repeat protein 39B [Halotydeus destructor]|nr:Tetratricopeptide repeat protein 39B [Halotydeus destructor]
MAINSQDGFHFDELHEAFNLAIDNRLSEAQVIVDKRYGTSLYHTLGSLLLRMKKAISLDKEELVKALELLKTASNMADRERKKSWSRHLWRQDYNSYTDHQVHAELIYAESTVCLAAVSAVTDQSLVGFVSAALYIKSAHLAYNQCLNILKYRKTWLSVESKVHFESGVRLAIGGFDLAISFFPGKFVTLLEYVGFSGDRHFGLNQLLKAVSLTTGLRYPLALLGLGGYHCFFEFIFGLGEPDLRLYEELAKEFTALHPQSGYATLLNAIMCQLKGKLSEAVDSFQEIIDKKNVADKLENFCYLCQVWCHVFQQNWTEAEAACAQLELCNWSPACSAYIRALCLNMVADKEQDKSKRDQIVAQVSQLLKKVPSKKRKLGGKKAFHEKLVLENSLLYGNDPSAMMLPLYDVAYIFNFFQMFTNQSPAILKNILDHVQGKLDTLDESSVHYHDHISYLSFMKAICLRDSDKDKAKLLFGDVINLDKKVTHNKHLAPQAAYEMGNLYRKDGHQKEAKQWYSKAKKYSNYSTELMVNYRSGMAIESMDYKKIKSMSSRDIFSCAIMENSKGS